MPRWVSVPSVLLCLLVGSWAWAGTRLPGPAGMYPSGSLMGRALMSPRAQVEGGTLTRQFTWDAAAGLLCVTASTEQAEGAARPLLEASWLLADAAQAACWTPLETVTQTFDMPAWTGTDWVRVGANWQHPGQDNPSVRAYRAPRDGKVTISGPARKLHLGGDGVRLSIRHGLRPLWQAEIGGQDTVGVEPRLTVDLKQGDILRFIVQRRDELSFDATDWDPVLTWEDGEVCRASDGFSADPQAPSDWSYQQERRDPDSLRQTPMAYSTDTWYESTFWTGPEWTRVGRNWQHTGWTTASARRFTCPREGDVRISGRVFKLHQDGDGVRVSVRLGERELWQAELGGADGTGREVDLRTTVEAGQALDFVVSRRGNIYCDTTGWDPVISYASGESYRASEGFSGEVGAGPWSYWSLPEAPDNEAPVLWTFTTAMSLVRQPLVAGAQVTLDPAEGPAACVLRDPQSDSGVVLAWPEAGRWRLVAEADRGRVGLTVEGAGPGSRELPRVWALPWQGNEAAASEALAKLVASVPGAAGDNLRRQIAAACLGTARDAGLERAPELDLWALMQSEWQGDERLDGTAAGLAAGAREHLKRAEAILARRAEGGPWTAALRRATAAAEAAGASLRAWRDLYTRARLVKRGALLDDPLLPRVPLLVSKRSAPSWSHEVAQYYGWRQRPGGSVYVLEDPGYSQRCRDLIAGRLPAGSFLEPKLSYDGKRVLFAYVACPTTAYPPEALPLNGTGPADAYLHIYEMNSDGSGLRQLTDGPYDDLMPVYLPGGDILFTSTRRQGYSRCFGPEYSQRWHSYTLHLMQPDGSGIRCVSRNDVSEWHPAVLDSGQVVYARWDYIDRDAVTHQNLWGMRPDGSNPVALWGNASPVPHCAFQPRPVPGSDRVAFIASAHHSITGGPLCLADPRVDANSLEAIRRVTPGAMPEAEGEDIPEYYESPWPLSEELYLVACSRQPLLFQQHGPNPRNALGVYVLDGAGNRELLVRDPDISTTCPTPLQARPEPPRLPDMVAPPSEEATGEFIVADVYQGLTGIARGAARELRVIQIFPKTTYVGNSPPIGLAGEENGRAILGTVPLEADGSARLRVPADKALLFQVLDAEGNALQTMRSLTYAQPGETTSCIGCHEPRSAAPLLVGRPRALARAASEPAPGALGGEPFSYMRVVQPVLDRNCAKCHGGERPAGGVDLSGTPDRGYSRSYWSLCGDKDFSGWNTNPTTAAEALVPRFGMRNQIQITAPGGQYGALGSRLMRMLREGHHEVRLPDADRRALAAWIDCNAIFYGVFEPAAQALQLAGKPVPMPEIQ